MKRRYFKENNKYFKFINDNKNKIDIINVYFSGGKVVVLYKDMED